MGGSPSQVRRAYRSRSPFLASEKDGGNAQLLKNIPIRLYTEPDVVWWIENYGFDYNTINAMDQAALLLQLRAQHQGRADHYQRQGVSATGETQSAFLDHRR
jgi:hypothetical protein